MTNFEKFKEQFNKDYVDLDRFAEYVDYDLSNIPYSGKVVESNHEDYDSYGNSKPISTIIYFQDFDVFVRFKSERQSFNGIIWDEMREVKETTKIINTYE